MAPILYAAEAPGREIFRVISTRKRKVYYSSYAISL
jgi:hypothetical protein